MYDPDLTTLLQSIAALQGELARLRGDLDVLSVTTSGHGDAIETMDEAMGALATRLQSGGATTTAAGAGGAAEAGAGGSNPWTAYGSTLEDHQQRLAAAAVWLEWANPVLITPRAGHPIAPCWTRHPGAVEEVLALHAAWTAAYVSDGPNDAMIAFHDRWLEPCIKRVHGTYQVRACARDGEHHEYDTPQPDSR